MDADFTFKTDCATQPSPGALAAVERTMFAAGFDVLDTVAIAHERRISYPYPVEIDALDGAGRHIYLISLGIAGASRPEGSPFVIHVMLYTRPPTRRDAALELATMNWMTADLRCSISEAARHENGSAALPTYDRTIADLKSRFEEARQMGAKPDALLMR